MEHKLEEFTTENGTYTTVIPDAIKSKEKWERPNPKLVHSFIPGTITELVVSVGDRVKLGDRLLMFNAMKMENTMVSSVEGVVKSIHVTLGEVVPNGALLLEFE